MQKTCGWILLIKSFIMLGATIILFFGGIALFVYGQNYKAPNPDGNNINVSCQEGFTKLFTTFFGIIGIFVGVILGIVTIIYLLNSRKILRSTVFPQGSVICLLVFEIIFSIIFLVGSFITLKQKEFLGGALQAIVFLQDLAITVLLIILLNNKNRRPKELAS